METHTEKLNGQVPATAQPQSGTMIAVIEKAAMSKDVDVEKLERMLQMQQVIMEKDAEIAFNQAMARLDFPPIEKSSEIKHNGKLISKYAKYEAVDSVIRPIYRQEGFSVAFNCRFENGTEIYTATLSHEQGHSKTAEMALPPDSSGAKNGIQAKGSTISYAQRYLVGMLFNLVFVNEDDDGRAAGLKVISTADAKTIKDLIRETGTETKKFLLTYGVNSVDELPESNAKGAIAVLKARKNAKGGAA